MWSLSYAAASVFWSVGGPGFPFGAANDPSAAITLLSGAEATATGPVIAALAFVGTTVAVAMARGWGRGLVRPLLVCFGVVAAFILALLIPDYRLLVVVAYAPIVVLGAPFGFPPETDLLAVVTWPVVNQMVCIGGGLLWAAASLVYWRRGRLACPFCGRSDDGGAWTSPGAARRWGRWATYVAVAVPIIYALTRWAWALGIPLGISDEFLRQGQEIGLWYAGAALATLAVAGALVTLGLVQSWGEVVPRWIPLLGGRRVLPALAIVPAGVVAVVVTSAGFMFWRVTLGGGFELGSFGTITLEDAWAAVLPELIWPLWGAALAAATFAYYLRRRGPCQYCGRG
jgi:hypothetical protein